MKKPRYVRLNPNLYYYCRLGKKPNMGKIRGCCVGKGCPHMLTQIRKRQKK